MMKGVASEFDRLYITSLREGHVISAPRRWLRIYRTVGCALPFLLLHLGEGTVEELGPAVHGSYQGDVEL